MVIAVDFDGTCVTHDFPNTGIDIGAEIVIDYLINNGCNIICISMRSDEHKETVGIDTIQAVRDWFKVHGLKLYSINDNPNQNKWSKSRKIYANVYIDDQFLGCPLQVNESYSSRPFVDWYKVAIMLYNLGLISSEQIQVILNKLKNKYPKLYMKYQYDTILF